MTFAEHPLPHLATVVDHVVALDPKPRKSRWRSLSLCILDAVWSIGANYDTVVVKVVRNVGKNYGIDEPLIAMYEPITSDPLPTTELAKLSEGELLEMTNNQRTSTRAGITKAEAALCYAKVFNRFDVTTLRDAVALLDDQQRLEQLDTKLRAVRGDGQHGIRRGYLWMLIGQDDAIKPDRMVVRWLTKFGVPSDPAVAREYIAAAASEISKEPSRAVTPWEIDHAIWDHQRNVGT